MLTLFTDPQALLGIEDHSYLDIFLHCNRDYLSPAAEELLRNPPANREDCCRAWADLFTKLSATEAPKDRNTETLLRILSDIETLALPEHDGLFHEALSSLPEGYTISHSQNRLGQRLRLWLFAQNFLGVIFPKPPVAAPNEKCEMPNPECSLSAAEPDTLLAKNRTETGNHENTETPSPDPQSKIQNQNSKIFAALAALSPAEYDRARKSEAQRLGLRLATLDAEVERCRDALDEAEADKVFLNVHDPWPEPITDPPALFDAVLNRFVTYAYLPDGAAAVCTAFLGHAHAFSAFHYTPRINVLSDCETCGKTTLVKIIAAMAPKPFRVHNLRPAVVYRVIDKRQPTVLLDEIETFLPLYRELLGLLNAGNSSDSCVPRCEGRDIRAYKAFAPVVLAGIGDLSRTLRSRSILIRMTEAPPTTNLTRFDSANLDLEKTLARKLTRWAADNLAAIAAADPVLPKEARNRVADNWRPLFQIAHVIGAHWPELVTAAFQALNQSCHSPASGTPPQWVLEPQSASYQSVPTHAPYSQDSRLLLEDVRAFFQSTGLARASSVELIQALTQIPNRPWSALASFTQKPGHWLAKLLKPHGIYPRPMSIQGVTVRGYQASSFARIPEQHSAPSTSAAESAPPAE